MALAVPSTTSGTGGSGSITITKPSGLAVDDLIVAAISSTDGGSGSLDTPTGWTQVVTASVVVEECAIYYKVATSSDVAASNFTFTHSGTAGMFGALLRVTGADIVNIPEASDSDTTTDNLTTVSFASGGTLRVPKNLQVQILTGQTTGAGQWTNLTSTPSRTFTEVAEDTAAGAERATLIGYSIIDDDTTVSAYGGVSDVTLDESAGCLVLFREDYPSSGTSALLESATTLFSQGGVAGTNGTSALLEPTTTINAPTSQAIQPTVWTNTSKS